MSKLESLKSEFQHRFGEPPHCVVRAPGRVNLIGEHTDYNQGFVLPMAIDCALFIAARRRPDKVARFVALDARGQVDEFALDEIAHHPDYRWANYVRGVACFLKQRGLDLVGMDAAIASEIPGGAGLSSSAALEVAVATTFQALSGFELDKVTLAQLCQRAENEFVGVQSGIMDQFASALGRAGQALLIDCRDLSYQMVPLPPGTAVVIADTLQKRHLAASQYNTRRAECDNAVVLLAQLLGKPLQSLRDVSAQEFRQVEQRLPLHLAQRARHVVTENARVLDAVNAARKRDGVTFGKLMNESQTSLRADYAASSPELDIMVECARTQAGCLGARLTGAGWGGATVNLVRAAQAETFVENLARAYQQRTGIEPVVMRVRASDGAGTIAQDAQGF